MRLRADAVITEERTSSPWILIETKAPKGKSFPIEINDWKKQLLAYKDISRAKYAVLLSPSMIFLVNNGISFECGLDAVSEEQALEIYNVLQRPKSLVQPVPPDIETFSVSDISTDTFSLVMSEYLKWLDLIRGARTNDEKKQSFEGLAKLLFDGIPFISCKALDLRTSSSEIDIVVEYRGWDKPTMFDEFGRFCLVECKNWQAPISAKHLRDFKGKLDKTKVKLGILFSRKGITGVGKGGDAVREIISAFDRDGTHILVVAEVDAIPSSV